MNLKQLIEETNKSLSEADKNLPKSGDSRVKNTVSERRVRSYINNKTLHKPFRSDGEIWYDESHLERLLAIRNLQNSGMSESAIKSVSRYYNDDGSPEVPINYFDDKSILRDLTQNPENFFSDVGTLSEALSIKNKEEQDSLNKESMDRIVHPLAGNELNISGSSGVGGSYEANPLISSIEGKKAALNNFIANIRGAGVSSNSSNVVGAAGLSSVFMGKSAINSQPANAIFDKQVLIGDAVASPATSPLVSSRSAISKGLEVGSINSALMTMSRSPVKSIQEYELDETGKIFLRIEDGAKISNPMAVLEKVKQILNIKE